MIVFENGEVCDIGKYQDLQEKYEFIRNYTEESETKQVDVPRKIQPALTLRMSSLNRMTAPESFYGDLDNSDGDIASVSDKKVEKFFTGENVQLGQVILSKIYLLQKIFFKILIF